MVVVHLRNGSCKALKDIVSNSDNACKSRCPVEDDLLEDSAVDVSLGSLWFIAYILDF